MRIQLARARASGDGWLPASYVCHGARCTTAQHCELPSSPRPHRSPPRDSIVWTGGRHKDMWTNKLSDFDHTTTASVGGRVLQLRAAAGPAGACRARIFAPTDSGFWLRNHCVGEVGVYNNPNIHQVRLVSYDCHTQGTDCMPCDFQLAQRPLPCVLSSRANIDSANSVVSGSEPSSVIRRRGRRLQSTMWTSSAASVLTANINTQVWTAFRATFGFYSGRYILCRREHTPSRQTTVPAPKPPSVGDGGSAASLSTLVRLDFDCS